MWLSYIRPNQWCLKKVIVFTSLKSTIVCFCKFKVKLNVKKNEKIMKEKETNGNGKEIKFASTHTSLLTLFTY